MQRSLRGDEAAFSQLYRRHAPLVARRLRRILFQAQDVEDVLQMTFLEVHRALPRYRLDASFGPWLSGIAFNVTGRYLRTKRRHRWLRFIPEKDVEREALQAADDSFDDPADRHVGRALVRAMARLPAKKRIAFALFELEEMTLREIGEVVGASPQTVWARVQSARSSIQKQMSRKSGDDNPGREA